MQSGLRLVYVVTHPTSVKLLLRGQLAFMKRQGFEVIVVTSHGPDVGLVREREGVEVVSVAMTRNPGGLADLRSLREMRSTLARLRPDIVNASTPKAGLLGMIAARALSVPVRIYLLRGLRLETEKGVLRAVLGTTERIASSCAHEIVCVSESLRKRFVDGRFARASKTKVLGEGSSNGVDVEHFAHTSKATTLGVARSLGLDPVGPTIGFVGRLSKDKGIDILLDSFARIREHNPQARLLMIGGDLADEEVDPSLRARVERASGVIAIGRVDDLAPYYPLMRVLAFPSRREGFPNVPLEAACAGVPTVAFRTTGVVDAVVHDRTGLLVDERHFSSAVSRYLDNPALRNAHGEAARTRATRSFANEVVWRAWADEYRRLLAQRGIR